VDDLNLPSGRTQDQVLENVYTRARARTTRRRVLVLCGPVAAVACAIVVVGATQSGGTPVRVLQPAATTSSTAAPPSTATTTTSSTTLPSTTSTTSRSTASTNSTSTTAPTTTTTAIPSCSPSDVSVLAVTDRATYTRTQKVVATGTVKNVSSRACHDPTFTGWALFDGNGNGMWAVGASSDGSADQVLQPGESRSVQETWDQKSCTSSGPCDYAPSGSYQLEFSWNIWGEPNAPLRARTAKFTIG
jgi:hypothetical protein